jgi:hypothetical protein
MSGREKRRKLNPDTEPDTASDTSNKAPNFELLPERILLKIAINLPGLDTLWNLLTASPRCLRLFNSHGLRIIEKIFTGPNSILPPKIQEIVRAVILTRAGTLLFKSRDELSHQFIHHKLPLRIIKDKTCITIGRERVKAANLPISVLLSVVATAHHISALTHACLASHLAQVYEPNLFAPQHAQLPLPLYKIRGSNPPEGDKTPAWHQVFVGTPYKVVDVGPPSWVEEMRVTRAMWLIQLVGDVRCLVISDLSASGWSYDDINRTLPTWTAGMAQDGSMNSAAVEVESVLSYLEKLGIKEKGKPYYRLPQLPPGAKAVNQVTALPDPCEATWGGVGIWYNYGYKTVKLPPTPEAREREENPQLSEASRHGQARSSLDSESPAVTMLRHFTEGRYGLPITNARFDTYRPFGLAFWDKKRLNALGLLGEGQQTDRDLDFYCFAWESLMDASWVRHIMTVLRQGVALENDSDGSGPASRSDSDSNIDHEE